MRIAISCDHAGFNLKKKIIEKLMELNQVVIDLGTDSELPVDFPDYAEKEPFKRMMRIEQSLFVAPE
jgi:ribose 5-phosphate isomerase B